uniref:14-3-3 domain-containing protein n=1 Tax=Monodelphis domestica TaxID=13616 RepID=A0A5F8HE20_MONDO
MDKNELVQKAKLAESFWRVISSTEPKTEGAEKKILHRQSKVFYLKMKGDYYRYSTEVAAGDDKKGRVDQSQ